MTTLDTVFLIITACAISLFFILAAVTAVVTLVFISKIKKLVAKAESLVDSVEEATTVIKNVGANASGPLAMLKVVKNIVDIVQKRH